MCGESHLEWQAFGVWPVGHQHRVASFLFRAKDVGPNHQTIVHGDFNVPIDLHVCLLIGLSCKRLKLVAHAQSKAGATAFSGNLVEHRHSVYVRAFRQSIVITTGKSVTPIVRHDIATYA